jgi:hypothetical protein
MMSPLTTMMTTSTTRWATLPRATAMMSPLLKTKMTTSMLENNDDNKYEQTTTNQKHVGMREEEKERRCNQGVVWEKCILYRGMVHAKVHQKLVKSNKITSFI